jgi:hypothetical protein
MSESPPRAGPDGASPGWDSLSFGGADRPARRRPDAVVGLLVAGVLALAGDGLAPAGAGAPPRIASLTVHPAPPSIYTAVDRSITPLLPHRPVPPATRQPTGLGTAPTFDRLARECYKGEMHSCDVLYVLSTPGSRYEIYADSCAGRQPQDTDIYCTAQFPGA